MRKIPTVFVRDPEGRAHVLPGVNPGCEWVLDGEGQATRKYDGTCVMLDEYGDWWARREVKAGKTPPDNYLPIETDETTGKTVGWEPIEQSAFAKHFEEALSFARARFAATPPGTYELIGPRINGNPERREFHELVAHADATWVTVRELSFDGIGKAVLAGAEAVGCEGIVWHHPDGVRFAKIKARDFKTSAGD